MDETSLPEAVLLLLRVELEEGRPSEYDDKHVIEATSTAHGMHEYKLRRENIMVLPFVICIPSTIQFVKCCRGDGIFYVLGFGADSHFS